MSKQKNQTQHFFPVSWARGYDQVRIYGIIEDDAYDPDAKASCIVVRGVNTKVLVDLGRTVDWSADQLVEIKNVILKELSKGNPKFKWSRPIKPICTSFTKRRVMSSSNLIKNANEKWEQKKFDFVEFEFDSNNAVFELKRILDGGIVIPSVGNNLQFFCQRDSFELWYQLMLRRGLSVAQWFCADNLRPVYDQQTRCDVELWCTERDLRPREKDFPIPHVPVLAYDCEMYASRPNTFCDALQEGDKIFQISVQMGKRVWLITRYPVDEALLVARFLNVVVTVIKVKSEYDLLCTFAQLVADEKPLITLGYNNMIFDMPYMLERCRMLCCEDIFMSQTLHKNNLAAKKHLSWSSKARPDQEFYYLLAEGIQATDLFPLIFADHKLTSYKLGAVGDHFGLGSKDDLSPDTMFKLYAASAADPESKRSIRGMTEVGAYCIRDTMLTLDLFNKLNYLAYCVCLADITNCQIIELATRGTQFKTEQNVVRFCWEEERVFDGESHNDSDAESYRGAVVFDPQVGRHYRIVSLDFASLYPSLIIAYNLCPTTLVTNPDIPDDLCEIMDWHDDVKCEHDERWQAVLMSKEKVKQLRAGNKASKKSWNAYVEAVTENKKLCKYNPDRSFCKHHRHRWFKGEKGVFPRVLEKLLAKRKEVRKELAKCKTELGWLNKKLKECTNETDKQHLLPQIETFKRWIITKTAQQLCLKVCANAMYGFSGSNTSKIPCVPVAMSTTYTGRAAIRKATEIVENEYGGKVLYGDSVTADTPVFVKNTRTGIIHLKAIEDVCQVFVTRSDGKEQGWPVGWNVWSETGWVPCKSVIRHKTDKQIWRVGINAGTVDVTEDHSLLAPNGTELKPTECVIGTQLLFHPLPNENNLNIVSETEAFVWGFFFADGSCGQYKSNYQWYVCKQNLVTLDRILVALKECEKLCNFKIINVMKSSKVYRIICTLNKKYLVKKYRPMFYDKNGIKLVPLQILNSDSNVSKAFLEGYWLGDGNKTGSGLRCSNKGAIGSAGLSLVANKCGFQTTISTRVDKKNIFRLTLSKCPKMERNKIKTLYKIKKTSQYVYDIEAHGHFSCGVGELVVHNTDSNYVYFGCKIHNGKEQVANCPNCLSYDQITSIANSAAETISATLPNAMGIVFEDDVYDPWILFGKKQYAYKTLKPDGTHNSKIGAKGILLARRDNCSWIKSRYTRVLNGAFDGLSAIELEQILIEQVQGLFHRQLDEGQDRIDYSQFVVSKSVKDFSLEVKDGHVGGYKQKKEYDENCEISRETFLSSQLPSHAQLAKRCCDRGLLIVKGERVPYLVTNIDGHNNNEDERLEHYEFFIDSAHLISLDRISYSRRLCSAADTLMTTIEGERKREVAKIYPCFCKSVDVEDCYSEDSMIGLLKKKVSTKSCIWCKNGQLYDMHQFCGRGELLVKHLCKFNNCMQELRALFAPKLVSSKRQVCSDAVFKTCRAIIGKRKGSPITSASKQTKLDLWLK